MKVSIKFKLQDFWIGVFWESRWTHMSQWSGAPPRKIKVSKLGPIHRDGTQWRWGRESLTIYVCLVPCFPIKMEWR